MLLIEWMASLHAFRCREKSLISPHQITTPLCTELHLSAYSIIDVLIRQNNASPDAMPHDSLAVNGRYENRSYAPRREV